MTEHVTAWLKTRKEKRDRDGKNIQSIKYGRKRQERVETSCKHTEKEREIEQEKKEQRINERKRKRKGKAWHV